MSVDAEPPSNIDSISISDTEQFKSVSDQAKDIVDKLYNFRDQYFHNRDINEQTAKQKILDVKAKLDDTLETLNSFNWDRKDKADYHLFVGKALNVVPSHDPQCQEDLSKAIKLNPKLLEAWYQLGECHWKKNDIDGAYNCFKSALEYRSDKHILRAMSMVVRQLPSSSEDKKAKFLESIDKAKEALKLDISDGNTWAVLGNAYLSAFFSCPFNSNLMGQALSAYQKAINDPIANSDADLHYNYGIALQYESDFNESLRQLYLACCLDPTWKYPRETARHAIAFLDKLLLSVNTRGKMKEKRFRRLVDSLRDPKARVRDLGPFAPGGQSKHDLKVAIFEELKEGPNEGVLVLCRVVCGVEVRGGQLAYTVVAVDERGALLAVRVFNLGQGKGPVQGDCVLVPEPFLERLAVSPETMAAFGSRLYDEDHAASPAFLAGGVSLLAVRVPVPSVLVVNGRRVGEQWTALPVVKNFFFTDNWLSATN